MKSAYEKAMERLEKESGPTKKLTDDQRADIAEIDSKFDARAAQARLEMEPQIATAGSATERAALERELASTLSALEADRNQQKEKVWDAE